MNTTVKVQLRSGKIHAADKHDGFMSLPICGGNRAAEGYREVSGEINCANCAKVLAKRAAAEATSENPEETTGSDDSAIVSHVVTTNQGETMTETATPAKLDVNEDAGKAALEQIDANIERAKSLAEADNAEALEELGQETETIISALSGKGSIKAKKEKREAWKVAAVLPEKPKSTAVAKKAAEGVVVAKSWDAYEGTVELVAMGAEKVAEGIKAHVKVSNLAKEIAGITYDITTRIPNRTGVPDLMMDSAEAKKAARAVYEKATDLFEDDYDNSEALKKLMRSAQDYRSDVRAEWLRSLDGEDEIAAERRAIVAKVLEGKPEDKKASEWVAKVYNTDTIGQAERKRLAYQEKKKALEAASDTSKDSGNDDGEDKGEGEGGGSGAAETSTPDERVRKVTDKIIKDITGAKPEDFEASSDETKEAVRKRLEEAKKAITAMIAATL